MGPTTRERFAAKVIPGPWSLRKGAPGRCRIWTGSLNGKGYARFWVAGAVVFAHRWIYAQTHDIPPGYEVDHLCRNRACVNEQHLEAVPHRINVLRSSNVAALRAAQTACHIGHEFTPANTRRRANGTRECIACARHRRAATRTTNPERQAA
jgi:hypothetical protein